MLLALFLYRYRRARRVQAFLIKYTPFRVSPYTDDEKKRSSMGGGLLFTDGYHGDALMGERRSTLGYGTIPPPPVTQPDPAAARPERPDGPPQITTSFGTRRPGSPISPFEVSPLSDSFPQSPPPIVSKRASQDSVGGVSIASSGVFSASLLTWPVPPSAAPSIMTSPPSSSHDNIAALAARYKPMTPTHPTPPAQPLSPSNWERPAGWD